MAFTIRVVNDDQEGVGRVKVGMSFTAFGRSMTQVERTDDEGRAEFDGYRDGDVEVYLDGRAYGRYYYADGHEITILF